MSKPIDTGMGAGTGVINLQGRDAHPHALSKGPHSRWGVKELYKFDGKIQGTHNLHIIMFCCSMGEGCLLYFSQNNEGKLDKNSWVDREVRNRRW